MSSHERIDGIFGHAVGSRKMPGIVAIAATAGAGTLYERAFGQRELGKFEALRSRDCSACDQVRGVMGEEAYEAGPSRCLRSINRRRPSGNAASITSPEAVVAT